MTSAGEAAAQRRRDKGTRRTVILADRTADWTIRIGGLAVILAVAGILVFLVQVVVPLFTGGHVSGKIEHKLALGDKLPLAATFDEYRTIVAVLAQDGTIKTFHLGTGKVLTDSKLDFAGKQVTAFDRTLRWDDLALGFADGTVRFGRLQLRTEILKPDQLPAGLEKLNEQDRTDGQAIYSAVPGNQFRKISVAASLEDEQKIAPDGTAITAINFHLAGTSERPVKTFITVDAAGVIRLSRTESRANMLTKKVTTTVSTATMPALPEGAAIDHVLTTESADQVYVSDTSGRIFRFDTREFDKPTLAETVPAIGSAKLNVMQFLIGQQSLVVGRADGSVNIFFRLQRKDAPTKDGYVLVRAHELEKHAAPVVAFTPSQRTKSFVTADAAGNIFVRHATSEQTLIKIQKLGASGEFASLLLAPRDDGVLALDRNGLLSFWYMSIPHPETTLKTIFGKVWYEGYDAPSYTWQSSAGTDSFEPKLSLIPLIFGTLKATLYALLFAVPVALLAAIFTSEFCHPRVRGAVKPVMEMMASLPSVVLGFIAALVLAPFVESWIAAVILMFIAMPVSFFVVAFLWQLLPRALALRLDNVPKFVFMFVVFAGALLMAAALADPFERLFFAGDFKAWANGTLGSSAPFVFLILLPLAFLLTSILARRVAGNWLQRMTRPALGQQAALFDLLRWIVLLAVACLAAYGGASLLEGLGYDPRGGVVGTYQQRNTLVVGFAMGFAVIPIIYTIAEDALNAVPEHLRAASLACGATRWQTATRVILPTAVSGVFAAVMVGMGRAVGETMIVVMAAGNTPVLEWNIFSGLRALSANIAVELPEAVKDGTLYRMLFLAALTLFAVTFVVNTAAEVIRQRYRKRSVQL